MKRVLVIMAISLLAAGCAVLLGFTIHYASQKRLDNSCREVRIEIERGGHTVYLQESDIQNWIKKHGITLKGHPIRELSAAHVESVLRENPYVSKVQVYATEDGVFYMDIWQRNPVLKVISSRGGIFQIDEQGVEMPDNPVYRARLRVASGNIPFAADYGLNVKKLKDSSSRRLLKTLFAVNEYLSADPFWDALFEQIYVTSKREIELIPKVGWQIVQLGPIRDMEDLEEKMFRLRVFYQNGTNDETWQKYTKLNLKYKNQLVATRRAGY